MSIKGTRPVKNLTTLIECSENGDDSASPMLPSDLTVISSVNDIALSTVEDANAEDLTPENPISNDKQSSSKHVRNSSDATVKSRRSDTSSKNSRRKRSSGLSADSSNDLSPEYGPSSSVKIFQQKEPSQKSFSFRAILNSVTAPVRRSKQEKKLSQSKDSAPLMTNDSHSHQDQCLPRKIEFMEAKDQMDVMNKTESDNNRHFTSDIAHIPLNIHHFRRKYLESVMNTMRDEASKSQEIEEYIECQVCFTLRSITQFPTLINCSHRPCRTCLELYLKIEIMENRVMNVCCPECSETLHPNDIYSILCMTNPQLLMNYERFMIRAVLIKEADTRWCPGQDCDYAVVANSCAACPKLECERAECGTLFCYHCKGEWHANQTCDEARGKSMDRMFASASNGLNRSNSLTEIIGAASSSTNEPFKPSDLKACPRCRTLILKLQDGSCNHMVCPMCQADFCWLCLKEISDLHYLSPTGCTFWGKKPWTRKKKLMWQIGTLIGAPVGIALIAGLAVPGIICGVPVFVGRKIHQRFANSSKTRRRLLTAAGVTGSLIFSPFLAVLAVGVGVPIMLAYTYGVVPLSLCRNGGCGGSNESTSLEIFADDEEELGNITNGLRVYDHEEQSRLLRKRLSDIEKLDQTSMATHISTNSAFSLNGPSTSTAARGNHGHAAQADVLSSSSAKINLMVEQRKRKMSAESYATVLGDKINFESASTKAQAGSHYHFDNKSVHTVCSGNSEAQSYCCENEESSSIKPMSGSIDGKSLGDSSSLRFVRQHRANSRPERDLSPSSVYSLNDQQVVRLPTQRLNTTTSSNLPSNGQTELSEVTNDNVGSTDNRDPFRVQSLLDNLRQILNDDDDNNEQAAVPLKTHKKRPTIPKQHKKSSSSTAGSRVSAKIQYDIDQRALSVEMPTSLRQSMPTTEPVASSLTQSGTVLTDDNNKISSETVKGKHHRRRFVSFFRQFRNNNDEQSSA